jgi:hypothetical protein
MPIILRAAGALAFQQHEPCRPDKASPPSGVIAAEFIYVIDAGERDLVGRIRRSRHPA